MSTPTTGGGLGQAASELLKEMHKAQAEMQQLEQKQKVEGPSNSFSQTMKAHQDGPQSASQGPKAIAATQASTQAGIKTQLTQAVRPGEAVANVLRQARIEQMAGKAPVRGQTTTALKANTSRFELMVDQLVKGQDKMTGIMNTAMSGKQFSPTELLGMQAGIYRYSQELDLTGKVVQQLTSGIKQTLNTQV